MESVSEEIAHLGLGNSVNCRSDGNLLESDWYHRADCYRHTGYRDTKTRLSMGKRSGCCATHVLLRGNPSRVRLDANRHLLGDRYPVWSRCVGNPVDSAVVSFLDNADLYWHRPGRLGFTGITFVLSTWNWTTSVEHNLKPCQRDTIPQHRSSCPGSGVLSVCGFRDWLLSRRCKNAGWYSDCFSFV